MIGNNWTIYTNSTIKANNSDQSMNNNINIDKI